MVLVQLFGLAAVVVFYRNRIVHGFAVSIWLSKPCIWLSIDAAMMRQHLKMVVPDLLEMLEVWYLREIQTVPCYSLHSSETLVSQAASVGGACWLVL